jgi:hypothetical protein
MSDKDNNFTFTTPEDFNERTSLLLPDAWTQVKKSSKFFSEVIKASGPSTFSATVVVFNCDKDLSAVVTSRPVSGKEDLYQSLCEILFLPMSIRSELFIVITDTVITDVQDSNSKQDAMNMTFVSPDFCLICTFPYIVQDNNEVVFDYDKSNMISITKEEDSTEASAAGDMLELFYIFSHVENSGPFHIDDVLAYFEDNNMIYEIINKENLQKRPASFLV